MICFCEAVNDINKLKEKIREIDKATDIVESVDKIMGKEDK